MEHLRELFRRSGESDDGHSHIEFLSCCDPVLQDVISYIDQDDLVTIMYVLRIPISDLDAYSASMRCGSIEMITSLIKKSQIKDRCPILPVKYGKLETLKWILAQGCAWADEETDVMTEAARYGQVGILRYMKEEGYTSDNILEGALLGNQTESLRWILGNIRLSSLRNGNLCFWSNYLSGIECFKILLEYDIKVTDEALTNFCNSDCLECFILAVSLVKKWNPVSCVLKCCASGSPRILEWIIESEFARWKRIYSYAACEMGNLNVLEWAYGKGYALADQLLTSCIRNGRIEIIRWLEEIQYDFSGETPSIFDCEGENTIEWFLDNRKWGEEEFNEAVRMGDRIRISKMNDKCLENGYSYFNILHSGYAAVIGDVSFLQFIIEKGCPLDTNVTFNSVYYDNLDCFKYAYESGCPADMRAICDYLEMNNRVDWGSPGTTFSLPSRCLLYINSPEFKTSTAIRNQNISATERTV